MAKIFDDHPEWLHMVKNAALHFREHRRISLKNLKWLFSYIVLCVVFIFLITGCKSFAKEAADSVATAAVESVVTAAEALDKMTEEFTLESSSW